MWIDKKIRFAASYGTKYYFWVQYGSRGLNDKFITLSIRHIDGSGGWSLQTFDYIPTKLDLDANKLQFAIENGISIDQIWHNIKKITRKKAEYTFENFQDEVQEKGLEKMF